MRASATDCPRDQWALSEWGTKSYRGIKALVGEEVARSGGEIPVDKLIERIAGALHLIGVTSAAARSDPIAALAAAIGMAEETPVTSVIDRYRKRGETDIADLLSAARDELEEQWRSAFSQASC